MTKMEEKIWNFFSDVFYIVEMFIFVIMVSSLCFALGHYIGFKSGLDTKVTYVGEKYTMKLKKDMNQEMTKSLQKNYGKIANLPKEMHTDTFDD